MLVTGLACKVYCQYNIMMNSQRWAECVREVEQALRTSRRALFEVLGDS